MTFEMSPLLVWFPAVVAIRRTIGFTVVTFASFVRVVLVTVVLTTVDILLLSNGLGKHPESILSLVLLCLVSLGCRVLWQVAVDL